MTLLKSANDGKGFVVRLYNPGGVSDEVRFSVRIPNVLRIFESDVWERKLEELGGAVMLAPHEILRVVVTEAAEN